MSTPTRRSRRPNRAATPQTAQPQGSAPRRESRYRPRPAVTHSNPEANRVLRLTLAEPQAAPFTDDQYRQAVKALSAMIVAWLQRQAHHGRRPDG